MKILACDYDGTLNVGGTVSEENMQAIAKWRAAGNLFGMVSGRYLRFLREYMEKDGIPYDFLIGNNGAVISDESGKAAECTRVSVHTAQELLCKVREYHPFHISVSYGEGSVQVQQDSCISVCGEALIIGHTRIDEVTQLHASFINAADALSVRNICRAEMGDEVKCIMPGPQGIDFLSARAGKAVGLRRLIELRGIAPEIILTVGDGENDLDMLTAPDFCGTAMQTSMPVVLEKVSRTTESVAALIEAYL